MSFLPDFLNILFNETDIDKAYLKGYVDEAEEEYQKKFREEIKNIKYTKLTLTHEEN